MVLKVRATPVEQRTQLINAMRGHAGEFGVISGRGTGKVAALRAEIGADTAIPPVAHDMLALLGEHMDQLDCRINALEAEFEAMHKANAISQLLATAVRGVKMWASRDFLVPRCFGWRALVEPPKQKKARNL
jgi:transposase